MQSALREVGREPLRLLMYHDVRPHSDAALKPGDVPLSPSIQSYTVTPERFAEHLAAVGPGRWIDPAGLTSATSAMNSQPGVLLTFDDGWQGTVEFAGPILERFGARAILFVTSGLLGHPLFVTESSLRQIPASRFVIGSHTVTHPFLAELPESSIRTELVDSRKHLEDVLGRSVDMISIPNGSFDRRVESIALESGYSWIFTSETSINELPLRDPRVGRVAVRTDTTADTVAHWCQGNLGSASWRRRALNLPKSVLGPGRYRRLRSWALGESSGDAEMSDLVARHLSR